MKFGVRTATSVIPITKRVTKIGRHTSNDVVLNNLKVTRHHAEIRLIENRIFIVDSNTLNGTFLGDTKILPDRDLLLKIGDNLGIGCKVTEDKNSALTIVEWRDEDVRPIENEASNSKDSSRQAINLNVNVFLGNAPTEASNELQQVIAPSNAVSAASSSSLIETLLPKISAAVSSAGIVNNEEKNCTSESSLPIVITEAVSLAENPNSAFPSSNRFWNSSDAVDKDGKRVTHAPRNTKSEDSKSTSTETTIASVPVQVPRTEVLSNSAAVSMDSTKLTSMEEASYPEIEPRRSVHTVPASTVEIIKPKCGEHSESPSKDRPSKSRKRRSQTSLVECDRRSNPCKVSKMENIGVITIPDSEEENSDAEGERLTPKSGDHEVPATSDVFSSSTDLSSSHQSGLECAENSSSTSDDHSYAKQKRYNSNHCVASINLIDDNETEVGVNDVPTLKVESQSVLEEPTNAAPLSGIEPAAVNSRMIGKNECVPVSEPIIPKMQPPWAKTFIDLSTEPTVQEQDVKPTIPLNVTYSNTNDIITLDSDDEDFPTSQFDATAVDDVPDFSSAFEKIYEYGEDEDERSAIKLECNDSIWFEPVAQSDLVEGKCVFRNTKPVVDSEIENDSLISDEAVSITPDSDERLHPLSDADEEHCLISKADERPRLSADAGQTAFSFLARHERSSMSLGKHKKFSISANKRPLRFESKKEGVNDFKKLTDEELQRKYSVKSLSVELQRIDESNRKLKRQMDEWDGETKEAETRRMVVSGIESDLQKSLSGGTLEHAQPKKGVVVPSPVANASTFRKFRPDQFKSHHSRRHRPPTISEIRMTKDIKMKRKEKLKEIACKETNGESSNKLAPKPEAKSVVAKITQTNRNTKFAESLLSIHPSRTKEKKKEPVKRNEMEAPISRIHANIETSLDVEALNGKLKEKASKKKKVKTLTPCSDYDIIEEIIKKHCPTDRPPSTHEVTGNESTKLKLLVEKSAADLKISKKSDPSSAAESNANDVSAAIVVEKSVDRLREQSAHKSLHKPEANLKKNKPKFMLDQNGFEKRLKTVKFNLSQNDCKYFEIDREERRNNGIFAPAYKLNEQLIRESASEFDAAIAKVCSWNVRWLEEQQKNTEAPPLYPEGEQNLNIPDLIQRYKEYLKVFMFNSLWKAMFQSWNKPDNDFLPHTQYIAEKQGNMYILKIETVDCQKTEGQLWTICASQLLNSFDSGDEAMKGQIVILNFHVTRVVVEEPKKTMVFAYVANVTKIPTSGKKVLISNEEFETLSTVLDHLYGRFIQRIWFRIFAKPFKIVPGYVKVKILNYLKSYLRPFQALAMVARSPLTSLLIDSAVDQYTTTKFASGEDLFSDKFLDVSQRKAVAACLNSIFSPNPTVCLVDGAAGTGKTQVIVSLLKALFSKNTRNQFPDDLKILIVTTSDNVADDLCYRLELLNKKEKYMHLLRYGNCKTMHASMKKCTLDQQVEDLVKNDDGQKLINLSEEINNLRAKIHSIKLVLESKTGNPAKMSDARLKLTAGEKELKDMERENSRVIEQLKSHAAKEITVENADVIVTSTYSCWSSNFESDFVPSNANKGDIHKFTVCIFDDANHIQETGLLIPMMLMVRTLILVGDQRNWMQVDRLKSPYFRLLSNAPVVKLQHEYRIHPSIMQYVGDCFPLQCEKRSAQPNLKSTLVPFIVINVFCDQGYDEDLKYEEQATFCAKLVEKLDRLEEPKIRFGVIISRELQKEIIRSSLQQSVALRGRKIIVDPLEEFSGREQDVVIVCLPFKRPHYDSWLYVAVTRAKSSLIICGDFSHIQNIESVDLLIKQAKRKDVFVNVNWKDNVITDYLVKNHKVN